MSSTDTSNIEKARDIAAQTIADHAKGEDSGPAGMDWVNACQVGERRELRVGQVAYVIDRRPPIPEAEAGVTLGDAHDMVRGDQIEPSQGSRWSALPKHTY